MLTHVVSLCLFVWLLSGAGCVSISLFPPKMPLQQKTVQGTGADKILMLDVSGIIAEGKEGNLLDRDESMVARIKEELTLAADDEHIKAVLLRINSPGGSPVQSPACARKSPVGSTAAPVNRMCW